MIKTQFDTILKILKTDNRKEYFNRVLGIFLIENEIIHQSSRIITPQHNRTSERKKSPPS